MSVVLCECADAQHAVERAGGFVPMNLAEFRQALWQVTVTGNALFEDLYVARTVHRLDRILAAVLGIGCEHVLAERLPVARGFPQ